MTDSRIPGFANKSVDGMTRWFSEMSLRGLLFHPEDRPADIVDIATSKPFFTRNECEELKTILDDMFERFGDGVCEAAYPVFMRTARLGSATQ